MESTKVRITQPGMPPPPDTWSTRADMLRDRAAARTALHRADMALHTMVFTFLLVAVACVDIVLAGFPFMPDRQHPELDTAMGSTVEAVIEVIIVAIWAGLNWWALHRTLRARKVGIARAAWADLEAQQHIRALPRGELDPALRAPFDARDDPDFARVADIELTKQYNTFRFDGRAQARAGLAGLIIAVSFVGLLSPFADWDWRFSPWMLLDGIILFGCAVVQLTKLVRRTRRGTRSYTRQRRECAAWTAERSETHGG